MADPLFLYVLMRLWDHSCYMILGTSQRLGPHHKEYPWLHSPVPDGAPCKLHRPTGDRCASPSNDFGFKWVWLPRVESCSVKLAAKAGWRALGGNVRALLERCRWGSEHSWNLDCIAGAAVINTTLLLAKMLAFFALAPSGASIHDWYLWVEFVLEIQTAARMWFWMSVVQQLECGFGCPLVQQLECGFDVRYSGGCEDACDSTRWRERAIWRQATRGSKGALCNLLRAMSLYLPL